MMGQRRIVLCLVGGVVCAACGGEPTESGSSSPSGNVAAEAIASCAGFTANRAASIVDAPAGSVQDGSTNVGANRDCSFRNAAGPSIYFTLSPRNSVQAAEASLASERQAMGQAQGAIAGATGGTPGAPATEDVSNLGDGAFYSSLNGAIMMRVANVMVQVIAPPDMALKRRVAEEVAAGLRP
jgi:hypothetical protein